ncbi:hypothetical protein ColTof4_13586 [Colletotrichum tofieldiae]|nr:hypothetical protein ColTof3_14535 [Colletotrichum tofieldiae]GKT81163.1 hypothetical protein ColTof4_13586 [Colletotrichum tofieldiae]GKT97325.1 hypothetical protein Ct61P_15175 [Colletotrichum tofieldiae]
MDSAAQFHNILLALTRSVQQEASKTGSRIHRLLLQAEHNASVKSSKTIPSKLRRRLPVKTIDVVVRQLPPGSLAITSSLILPKVKKLAKI